MAVEKLRWIRPPRRAIFVAMPPSLATVALDSPDGARAEVARHGAHVLVWRPATAPPGAGDRLFLADLTRWREGSPIRGGVPVVFPQFAERGPLPKHGFARTLPWELVAAGEAVAGGRTRARFRLVDTPATRALWPHPFAAELTVAIGGETLEVALAIENRGTAPLTFTGALHTYLQVDDVARAGVRGLRGVRYRDSADGGRERVEEAPLVTFRGEVDRIYMDAPPRLELLDGRRPVLAVESAGFRDVVIWNPGAEKAAAIADLEPGGQAHFVCIEAATVVVPVELAPGEHWTGAQTLTALAR
jgi:glucose-6-phosphate 1-epimerase